MSEIILKDMPKISMIRITNARVYDLDESIAASKYPMQTVTNPDNDVLTDTAVRLAQCKPGTGHDNWLCGIRVAFDIMLTAKCLVEFERYHFADIVSCNSTMHRITKFELDKAYCKYVDPRMIEIMQEKVADYNAEKSAEKSTEKLLEILYSNPCGFTYTMRIDTNYRQLKTMHLQRAPHLIPEWRELCGWMRDYLPHSELITGEMKGEQE